MILVSKKFSYTEIKNLRSGLIIAMTIAIKRELH